VLIFARKRYQRRADLTRPPFRGADPRAEIRRSIIHTIVGRLAVSGFERLYETARALGEETRFRIYRQVSTSDTPLSVSELADAFSLHPNAVRQHLARLEQAGLLVSRADRPGGAGRPRRLYESSPEPVELAHPPGPLRSLVDVLSGAMDTLSPDRERLVEFGRSWGRTWATRRKRENGGAPRSRQGRAKLLSRELAEWGWRPSSNRENGRVRLTTERCLFHDRAPGNHGRCCSLEEGLLKGLAEGFLNGEAQRVSVDGCRFEVTF
jgi:predicted ArsR family transcriptional regulator